MEGLADWPYGPLCAAGWPAGRAASPCCGGEYPRRSRCGYGESQVFTDGVNDSGQYTAGVVLREAVLFSAEPKPNTWHWIEQA